MELKITKEKVIAAANKCSAAKEVLKEMFPEVFEDDKYFNFAGSAGIDNEFKSNYLPDSSMIQIRRIGKYKNKAFYLTSKYNWKIERDNEGDLCLIPTKK